MFGILGSLEKYPKSVGSWCGRFSSRKPTPDTPLCTAGSRQTQWFRVARWRREEDTLLSVIFVTLGLEFWANSIPSRVTTKLKALPQYKFFPVDDVSILQCKWWTIAVISSCSFTDRERLRGSMWCRSSYVKVEACMSSRTHGSWWNIHSYMEDMIVKTRLPSRIMARHILLNKSNDLNDPG